jgi:hypothetical protein
MPCSWELARSDAKRALTLGGHALDEDSVTAEKISTLDGHLRIVRDLTRLQMESAAAHNIGMRTRRQRWERWR